MKNRFEKLTFIFLKLTVFIYFILTAVSCARFPNESVQNSVTRIRFTMQVDGRINPNYVYLVGIRACNIESPRDGRGPIPITRPPWGENGLIAGRCTHFVRWEKGSIPELLLYRFRDVDLINYSAIGAPYRYDMVQNSSDTIDFELTLPQLSGNDAQEASALRSLQVNFINYSSAATNVNSRRWDAIGNNGDPNNIASVTVPLTSSGTYNNTYFGNVLYPGYTSVEPDLKIKSFSIQVIRSTSQDQITIPRPSPNPSG